MHAFKIFVEYETIFRDFSLQIVISNHIVREKMLASLKCNPKLIAPDVETILLERSFTVSKVAAGVEQPPSELIILPPTVNLD